MEMQNLCRLRDVYRLIRDFEIRFQQKHGLCLNEGMLLCTLKEKSYSSGELAGLLGLTNSNASKVIKSAESKGLVERVFYPDDKRKMFFTITETGIQKLSQIKCEDKIINDVLMNMKAAD